MDKLLYTKYSNQRDSLHNIKTSIFQKTDGTKYVIKEACSKESVRHIENNLKIFKNLKNITENSILSPVDSKIEDGLLVMDFVEGKSLENILLSCISNNQSENFFYYLNEFKNQIDLIYGKSEFIKSEEFVVVFGDVNFDNTYKASSFFDIDLIFQNVIVENNNSWKIIDFEWTFDFLVPLNFLYFRAVECFCSRVGKDVFFDKNLYDFFNLKLEEIDIFRQMDSHFRKEYLKNTNNDMSVLYSNFNILNIDVNTVIENARNESFFYKTQLFFDFGDGYSEKDSIFVLPELKDSKYFLECILPKGLKKLRIDPCQTSCLVHIHFLKGLSGEELESLDYVCNGLKLNNVILFNNTDPIIEIVSDIDKYKKIFFEYVTIANPLIDKELKIGENMKDYVELEEELKALRERIIQEKDNELSIKNEVLTQKDNEIARIVESRDRELALKNEVIAAKDNEILRISNKIDSELLIKDDVIRNKDKDINDRDETIRIKQNELFCIKSSFDSIRGENNSFRETIVEKDRYINSLNDEINKKYNELLAKDCIIQDKNFEIANRIQDLALKQLELDNLRGSISWKITSFLRLFSKKKNKDLICEKLEEENSKNIKFSILMPVYNVDSKYLDLAIKSVENQDYDNWELCIVDDCSTNEELICYLKNIKNSKIKIVFSEKNGGISVASNKAAEIATGDFFILMDNDDEISPIALSSFYEDLINNDSDIIYSDQDIIDSEGNHSNPLYKPDWSPDLFNSQMYLGHLSGFKRGLFEKVGGFRSEFNGSQDYDLFLRMSEKTDKISHVSKILYSWRSLPSSTATNPNSKPYAQTAGLKAIQQHLDRTLGFGVATAEETENLFVYDIKYNVVNWPKVSIIMPTKDHAEDLRKICNSIYEKSTYKNFELIIMNNNSEKTETYDFFNDIKQRHDNVKVIDAMYEFNWSKLNNHGIREASGDVYIFLNNDMEVLSSDWIERLVSKAIQTKTGVVGGLLLYEDGTIQHAGVVAGLGGWADHIYKGMKPVHYGSPFISPMVVRNVTAVTGACLAISKETIKKIGNFREDFIICGSDVELCIRACQFGLYNIYDPHVRLTHYESKSRGKEIPDVDFKLSYEMYTPYRKNGDPFYNNNLDMNKTTPSIKCTNSVSTEISFNANTEESKIKESLLSVSVGEITEIKFRKITWDTKRLNILVPSINPEHVFGGISTALKFFYLLVEKTGFDCRIILTDAKPNENAIKTYSDQFAFVDGDDDCCCKKQIVSFADRYGKTLGVSDNDIFIFTGWWTAYCIQTEYLKRKSEGFVPGLFIYFIQDYEPGFYPWSSRYLLADSTYKSEFNQIAIFNSLELRDFFHNNSYSFFKEYYFEPILNDGLKRVLHDLPSRIEKKKQILVYGRPNTSRNAFELLVEALRIWVCNFSNSEEWEVLSAGELHDAVDLGNGLLLKSVGKLTIDEYANVLKDSYAGISLMVSPHPSYPPLEMAVYGMKVITNSYQNKDISKFNNNIVSLKNCSPVSIAEELQKICNSYESRVCLNSRTNENYCNGTELFPFMNELVSDFGLGQ